MPPAPVLLQLLIIGLTNGAVIALNAIAVTLVYGVVRALNLAHGDVFALITVLVTSLVSAWGLRLAGPPLALLGGLAVILIVAAGTGATLSGLIERIAFRPFRSRSRLAPLIATLGLSFILYQAALIWRYLLPNWIPGEHRSVPGVPELPRDSIPEVWPVRNLLAGWGLTLTPKDLLVLALAVLCALGVAWFLAATRPGKAIRAVAQNVELARMLGIDPEVAIQQTFLLGGALAGIAAFVFATYYTHPFNNAGAQSGLTAFVAALLGGIGNPLGALLAGLALGVGAAFSDYFLAAQWTPVLLQGLLIVVLLIRPTGLTGGADEAEPPAADRDAIAATTPGQRARQAGRWLWLLLGVGLAYPWVDRALGLYRLGLATNIAIFALLALGLNVLLGFAGLLDLGYAVSFGLGGYVAALATSPTGAGPTASPPPDFLLVLGLSALTAGAFGALNGALTRRLRSDYLAIVTLALGQMARQTLVNFSSHLGGGSLSGVPAPRILTIAFTDPNARYYLALALVVAVAVASQRLIQARVGRAWLAGSEDEAAAVSNGVNTAHYRSLAFILSSAAAGLAGALYVASFTYIDPDAVDFRLSTMALAMVILGGAGSVPGAILGAVIITGYDQVVIPLVGHILAQLQWSDPHIAAAFDARGLSYLNFGLALYLTVLLRARRRRT